MLNTSGCFRRTARGCARPRWKRCRHNEGKDGQLARRRPIVALAIGDPAGIGPELAARIIISPRVALKARLVVIGDRRILDAGSRAAGITLDIDTVESGEIGSIDKPVLIDLHNLDPVDVSIGEATLTGGRFRYCLDELSLGVRATSCSALQQV